MTSERVFDIARDGVARGTFTKVEATLRYLGRMGLAAESSSKDEHHPPKEAQRGTGVASHALELGQGGSRSERRVAQAEVDDR
jgi:hypothetical protein